MDVIDGTGGYAIAVKTGKVGGIWKLIGDRYPEHLVDAAHDEMHRIRSSYDDARVVAVTA